MKIITKNYENNVLKNRNHLKARIDKLISLMISLKMKRNRRLIMWFK